MTKELLVLSEHYHPPVVKRKKKGKDGIIFHATTPLSDDSSTYFSACIGPILDDKHWLIEWLAYHYHALNLRHVVFVRDPRGRTNPDDVLQRWDGRMLIEEWEDDKFFPQHVKKKMPNGLVVFRTRQRRFLPACIRDLKQRNRTWLLLTDADEFVRINPFRNSNEKDEIRQQQDQPGHVLQYLNQQTAAAAQPPKCLFVPRIQIVSEETTTRRDDTIQQETLPAGLNASQFLTYRWRTHNKRGMWSGKNILHLLALDPDTDLHRSTNLPDEIESVHQVLPICPKTSGKLLNHTDSWLQANHYLGSWEQFSFRIDPRNNRLSRLDKYKTIGRKPAARFVDHGMSHWLPGFVKKRGWATTHNDDEAMKTASAMWALWNSQ